MHHLGSLDNLKLAGSYVTVGSYDGVHRGHLALINQLVQSAHLDGFPAVVITFFPHPAVYLRAIQEPFYLTTPKERARLLGESGVDYVVTLKFDHHLAEFSARQFLQLLIRHLGLQRLYCGSNFALGFEREGNLSQLKELGQVLGFKLHIIQPEVEEENLITSSLIRTQLGLGRVTVVANLLGRQYSFDARIASAPEEESQNLQRLNISTWSDRLLPAPNKYIGWIKTTNDVFPALLEVFSQTFSPDPLVSTRIKASIISKNRFKNNQPLRISFIDNAKPGVPEIELLKTLDEENLDA